MITLSQRGIKHSGLHRVVLLAALVTCAFASVVSAQTHVVDSTCPTLSPEESTTLTHYVRQRYQIPDSRQFSLVSVSHVDHSCILKLAFQSGSAPRPLKLFLSADHRFLMPVLFDSTVDPNRERAAATASLMQNLTKGNPPSRGDSSAPVTIVEFSDFECPFCSRLAEFEHDLLAKNPNSFRIVFRYFPLKIHPWAMRAAEMAQCASIQDRQAFWKLHDYFFSHQKEVTNDNLRARVVDQLSGLKSVDLSTFDRCMDEERALGVVAQDQQMGAANGISGTPTLYINGRRYVGMRDEQALAAAITEAAGQQPVAEATTAKADKVPSCNGKSCVAELTSTAP